MAPLQSFRGAGLSSLRRDKSLLSRPPKPPPLRELPRGTPHYLQPPPLLTRAAKKELPSDEAVKKKKRVRKGVTVDDTQMQELLKIAQLVPKTVRNRLLTHPELENLLEVVMDLGRVPFARFPSEDFDLSRDLISEDDLEFAIAQLGEFGGDNRAGISSTLHRISCIRNRKGRVIGLTARVGRHVPGSAEIVADIIQEGKSILLLGLPGRGKTTAIRSMCKLLADVEKKRVVIVDTSNEIAGDGDVPHESIGRARRMQVAHPSIQHEVMIEAVENHMPQVIVIDEIGTEMECSAAQTISQRGVQLIATAHGTELENVIKNPHLQDLIGGIECVTLGDDEAKRRGVQKSVLERGSPPAFDVCIEMVERDSWRVHHDLAEAVDTILTGGTAYGEMRTRLASGEIKIEKGKSPTPVTLPLIKEKPLTSVPFAEEFMEDNALLEELEEEKSGGKHLSESDLRRYQNEEAFCDEWSGDSDWNFFQEGPATEASPVVMRLFLIGVEQQQLQQILEVLGLKGAVTVTTYMKKANAVLGTQTELKRGTWVEKAARVAGIPLFCLNSSSNLALAKAVQSLLGFSSSTDVAPSKRNEEFPEQERGEKKQMEKKLSTAETHALDEVRFAIEDIIVPRKQPVELLPQVPHIIQLQMEMIKDYDLPCRSVGEGNHTRLRIYPAGSDPET